MLYYNNIITKYILLIIIILFVANCENLEFVYKSGKQVNELKKNTSLIISGDDSDEIYSYIEGILESSNIENPNYKLFINSTRIEEAQVIGKDATASKFSIKYNIIYNLDNINKNCKIAEIIITTKDSYDAKSAGYSFGTDLSKKETKIKIISKNIDQFISSINKYSDLNNC